MSIIRQAIEDKEGDVDVGNLSLFWVLISVLGAITVVCVLAAAIVLKCIFTHGMTCTYDPQPLGIAVGAICGGFAAALGALGAYMRLVQPPKGDQASAVGGDAGTVIVSQNAAPNLPPAIQTRR